MDIINIEQINILLQTQKKKQRELAEHIGMQKPALSEALNGNRPFPMGYIFKVASFFNIEDAKTLIIQTITSNEKDKKVSKEENLTKELQSA